MSLVPVAAAVTSGARPRDVRGGVVAGGYGAGAGEGRGAGRGAVTVAVAVAVAVAAAAPPSPRSSGFFDVAVVGEDEAGAFPEALAVRKNRPGEGGVGVSARTSEYRGQIIELCKIS